MSKMIFRFKAFSGIAGPMMAALALSGCAQTMTSNAAVGEARAAFQAAPAEAAEAREKAPRPEQEIAEYNQGLSERRALAVRQALLDRGIESTRIDFKGYGEKFPVATNATAAGREMNRRVEIIISDEEGAIPGRTE